MKRQPLLRKVIMVRTVSRLITDWVTGHDEGLYRFESSSQDLERRFPKDSILIVEQVTPGQVEPGTYWKLVEDNEEETASA